MTDSLEAIVVLNGSVDEADRRVAAALELQQKTGIPLIASGGFRDHQIEMMRSELADSDAEFYAERSSRDTVGNSLWTHTDVLQRNFATGSLVLHLVTSGYHINRASWLFSETSRRPLMVVGRPVETPVEASGAKHLATKERLLTSVGWLLLAGCDFSDDQGYQRAKRRVRNVFWHRYHSRENQ